MKDCLEHIHPAFWAPIVLGCLNTLSMGLERLEKVVAANAPELIVVKAIHGPIVVAIRILNFFIAKRCEAK